MRFVVTVILAFLFSGSAMAQGALQDNAHNAVVELENRWLHAENDPVAIQSILADDFIHVLPMGFVTKDEQIAYLRSHPAISEDEKRFENLTVRVYGDTAVATGVVVASKNGKTVRRTMFTDVFVKRRGKWQAVNAQELPEKNAQP